MNRFEAAIVVALLSVASCRSAPTPEMLAQFEAATSLHLPPTARVVGVERLERGWWRAKAVLDEKAFATFLETMPMDEEWLEHGTGGYLGGDDDWWDPNAAQNIRTGQVPRDVGGYLNIGIDDTARDAVLVYVFQFGP